MAAHARFLARPAAATRQGGGFRRPVDSDLDSEEERPAGLRGGPREAWSEIRGDVYAYRDRPRAGGRGVSVRCVDGGSSEDAAPAGREGMRPHAHRTAVFLGGVEPTAR